MPVLYCHGSPDSRLARHPDDEVARVTGVRLLAVDRPGIGHSDPDARATPSSVADDLVAVLDRLEIGAAGVLAWSAGSIFALALAGSHPDRVRSVVLAAPLVPADAYDDPTVLDGSDEARRLFADVHRDMDPDDLGAELAPWLVPPAIDRALAREMLAASIGALRDVPGADDQLIAGLRASVAQGLVGIERDIVAQATRLGPLLERIAAPVDISVGRDDTVTPPAMARWLGRVLDVEPSVIDGVGHELPIRHWADLLGTVAGR